MSGIYGQPSRAHQVQGAERGGIGFVGLLTIAFIILKLTGAITWSWWWVLAPLWISFGLWLALILFGLLLVVIGAALSGRRRRR